MTDDAQRWKSKYLESLEQQEKLERSWDARLDLLRRGLVRSSLAAEGSDKSVDQCMQELRDILRRDDIDAGLSALIPRLERAVLDSEKSRQDRLELNVSGVTSLTDQLLALEPPREVRKALKQFAKRIEERASQPRELPALLSELSRLQQQVLAAFDGASPVRRVPACYSGYLVTRRQRPAALLMLSRRRLIRRNQQRPPRLLPRNRTAHH